MQRQNLFTEDADSLADKVSKILNEEIKRTKDDSKQIYYQLLSLEEVHLETTYRQVVRILQKYCQTFVTEMKRCSQGNDIETYAKFWKKYMNKVKVMNTILAPINNKHVILSNMSMWIDLPVDCLDEYDEKVYTIERFMLKIWAVGITLETNDELVKASLDEIDKLRKGEQSLIDSSKEVFDSFIKSQSYLENNELDLYKSAIEQPMIERTTYYYGNLAKNLIVENGSDEYIVLCPSILEREREISRKYYAQSEKLVYEAAWKSLVLDHIEEIKDYAKACMKLEKLDNISIPYTLSKFSPATAEMFRLHFQNHEEEIFSEIRKSCDDSLFCETFIKTYQERLQIVNTIYESDNDIISALEKAVAKSVNAPLKKDNNEDGASRSKASYDRIPLLIVEHCDNFLKKGTMSLSDTELDKNLEGAMTIFKYIEDKDVFKEHYSKKLAKRLIQSISQSTEVEESMIKKLKLVCGSEYVLTLEKMISDFKISQDETQKFKGSHGSSLPYSVNAMVLQSGSWPIPAIKSSILVPQELEKGLLLFDKFYIGSHAGRKLIWNHNLSTCEIRLKYFKRPYAAHTTVTIVAILMTFNQNESARVSEISYLTSMGLRDLLKYLQWLVNQKVLMSADAKLNENSMVSVNDNYENKKPYFKLIPNFSDTDETRETVESVVNERKFILQALIVKIMKGSKTISHKDLINEVVRQSMPIFVPSHTFIKSVIQTLIENEYLRCKEEGSDVYDYMA